ncbi:hypothetical protein BOSE127_110084 [Bosea sp. 127]|nr:hypothetical protein BOSE7B_60084 [Bosea sp. 7B]VXB23963.1 hypothetical protein BOSE127_110084 [Bosea sp. 127]
MAALCEREMSWPTRKLGQLRPSAQGNVSHGQQVMDGGVGGE